MERELKSKHLVSGTVIEIKFFKKRNFIEHRNTDKGGKLKKKKKYSKLGELLVSQIHPKVISGKLGEWNFNSSKW